MLHLSGTRSQRNIYVFILGKQQVAKGKADNYAATLLYGLQLRLKNKMSQVFLIPEMPGLSN